MNDDLLINFTPTGMIPTKADNPHVPITPDEIIEDVRQACELGISMVHLHARDCRTQEPVYQKEPFAQMIGGIRTFAPDLVICVTTSGRTYNEFEKRSDVLKLTGDLKPDMGSLTLSSLNFNKQASINTPDMIVALAKAMQDKGIKPEAEAFDAGMINYLKYLIKKQLMNPPYYVNLILGNVACAQADLLHAGVMINDLPDDSYCSMGGIGNRQLQVNSMAISMGFGVRVGLEDNIWYDKDNTRPARNIDLLERVHLIAAANQRRVMKPAQLRALLKLDGSF
ncbi:MAG: 3-keto-5-aminohexanoate cleavage protein [Planctomycetales bacterium]|nr:3-keto-5-aminohexanoate cleavage protein [Planctomycetales bacterium]